MPLEESKRWKEEIRRYQEKPVEEYSVQQPGTPRFSVTISGPRTLSLADKEKKYFVLNAQLHYHSDSGDQPITIRNGGIPGTGWNDQQCYLFYKADDRSVAEGVAVYHEFPDCEIDDEEVPVSAENGFSTILPGDNITRQIRIRLCWWFGLEVGGHYKLLMPKAYIGWWDYGLMENHKHVMLGLQDYREGGGLTIPHSNSIDVEVVA